MPQIVRFGCAGVAVIIIAALTSIGLYAVLTGGFPFGGPAPKPITGGAQVLVTIQAGQPTPTPPSASTPTPAGGSAGAPAASPASALAAPIAVAAAPAPTAPPTPTATAAPLQTPAPATASSPAANPSAANPSGGAANSAKQTVHEGLTAEIVEVERGWQATDAAGAPIRVRDGQELLTVQVRLTNSANESRYVADGDLVLVSEDGARFAPKQAAPQREPRLLTMPLLPGDTVRGWLTYETPTGQVTRRLQWSPTRPDRPRADTTFNLPLP